MAEPTALVVGLGQVVVGGEANGGDFVLESYDYAGGLSWEAASNEASTGVVHMAMGSAGQVAVCGWGIPGPFLSAGLVEAYDTQGQRLFQTFYNSPYGGPNILRKLAFDSTDPVVVVGSSLTM